MIVMNSDHMPKVLHDSHELRPHAEGAAYNHIPPMPVTAALILVVVALCAASASAFIIPKPVKTRILAFRGAASEIAADAEMFSEEHGDTPSLPPVPATAKRLFLVRHGEVINPGGDKPVYYGALDVPLSSLGEDEAQAAAKYLERFDLQHVAASPLTRAIYGAREILHLQEYKTKSDLVVYEGFKELDRGDWCGLTFEEIGADMMRRFDDCDESVTPANGESFPSLKDRVLTARNELLSITDFGNASAVVSHLQVTRSMLSDALEVPTNKMSGLKVATASVTCIDYDISSGSQTVHFQSYKPSVGLQQARDMAN